LTNFEVLGKDVHSVEGNQVSLLLLLLRVDEKSPAGHGAHVTEFAANVDVDSLVAELLSVTLNLELVHVEAVARLDGDRDRVLKEARVKIWVGLQERDHEVLFL